MHSSKVSKVQLTGRSNMKISFYTLVVTIINIIIINDLVDAQKCGSRKTNYLRLLIMGGYNADPGEFPWFVQLKWVNRFSGEKNSCGGTLIKHNWVLTAAHCVMDFEDSQMQYTAYVGISDLYSRDIRKHQAKVLKAFPHEDFTVIAEDNNSFFTVKNDIALVKIDTNRLAREISLVPICLPDEGVTLTDECWIAGFGDDENGSVSKLKKIKDLVINDRVCLDKKNFAYDSTSQVCVGGTKEGGKGSCHGDSGSALQCKGDNGRFYQLGVASYLTNIYGKCAQPDSPDVYMKVSHYMDWIDKTINDNSNSRMFPLESTYYSGGGKVCLPINKTTTLIILFISFIYMIYN